MSTALRHPWTIRDADETRYPEPPSRTMSEEAFLDWATKNDVRAEWVEGEVIVMAPANFEHQDICGWLYKLLSHYVEHKELGIAVLDVWTRLAKPRRQIRAPDVLFIANDRGIVSGGKVQGPPDLIMEVVSHDSESRDWREKFFDYQGAGVREYWVFDPASQMQEAYSLSTEGSYARIEEQASGIASVVVPGFYIKPEWIWRTPRARVLDLLPELGIKLG